MTEFRIPRVNLDFELFVRRNIFLARFVVLNALIQNDQACQAELLKRLHPEHFTNSFTRFLFQNIVEMIRSQGRVDIQELRRRIPSYAPNDPQFTRGCLANFDHILSLKPTPEHIERAVEMLTSPPPPLRF